jgi:excisionase family DNA binding protein
MSDETLLTTPQVAERLGVTVRRVQALIKDGRLPSQQFGRDHIIKESDLKLVENRKPGRPRKEGQTKESSHKRSRK